MNECLWRIFFSLLFFLLNLQIWSYAKDHLCWIVRIFLVNVPLRPLHSSFFFAAAFLPRSG